MRQREIKGKKGDNEHMIFRAEDVQASRRQRSMYFIEHIIASGKASYENNML